MFPRDYFATDYFATDYWFGDGDGAEAEAAAPTGPVGGGQRLEDIFADDELILLLH